MYVRTAPCQLAVQEADGGGLKDTNGGSFQGVDFCVSLSSLGLRSRSRAINLAAYGSYYGGAWCC